MVEPNEVGFTAPCTVSDPSIEIAIAVKIPQGNASATGIAQRLETVGELACDAPWEAAVVEPHEVGMTACTITNICDPCIEMAIAVEIPECHIHTRGVVQRLGAIGESEKSLTIRVVAVDQLVAIVIDAVAAILDDGGAGVVEEDQVGCTGCTGVIGDGDPCVEVAIAIQIAQGHTIAIWVPQRLAAVGEGARVCIVVEPDAVTQSAIIGNPSVEITIAIDIAKGNTLAVGVSQRLAAIGKGSGPVVEPDAVGFTCGIQTQVGDPCVKIAIAIQIAESYIRAVGVSQPLRLVVVNDKVARTVVDPDIVG